MKPCINCGHESDSPYCPNCGQKMEVRRVTIRGISGEFISKWIGFDTQFGRTIVGMVIKPGEVINGYLEGNRTKYIGPLGFIVVMTALLLISFDLFGLEVQDFLKENQSTFQGGIEQDISAQQLAFQQKINTFIAQNFRFFSAVLIPFWGIGLWFFYRKRGLNYIERIVVATYLSCQGIWLTIVGLAFMALTGKLNSLILLAVSILYYAYGLMKVYNTRNYFISLLKTIGSYAVSALCMLVFVIIIMIIVLMVMAVSNPEMFQPQG